MLEIKRTRKIKKKKKNRISRTPNYFQRCNFIIHNKKRNKEDCTREEERYIRGERTPSHSPTFRIRNHVVRSPILETSFEQFLKRYTIPFNISGGG